MEVLQSDKEQQWQEMMVKISKIHDRLGEPVDKGIKEVVAALNLLGVNTTGSCEGHTEDLRTPWVDIETEESYNTKAIGDEQSRQIRERINKGNLEQRRKIILFFDEFYRGREIDHKYRLIVYRKGWGSYIESLGASIQLIESEDVKKQDLQAYQEEMRAFGKFLKNKFFED